MELSRIPLIPVHAPGATLLAGDDGPGELTDASGRRRLRVDETALALWELCDGETTVDEMVAACCDLFDAAPAVVARDVAATLDKLGQADLLRWQAVPRLVP